MIGRSAVEMFTTENEYLTDMESRLELFANSPGINQTFTVYQLHV